MKPSCFQCMYFQVTWDPKSPRACKAYGFKSQQLPSIIVKKSSGMECLKFQPKQRGGTT